MPAAVFALILAVWPAVAFAGRAVICVDVSGAARPDALTDADVATALAARIAERRVQIIAADERRRRCTWRVAVRAGEADAVSIAIDGRGLASRQSHAVAKLGPHEIAELVALAAAEALRPSLTDLLRRLSESADAATEAGDEVIEAIEEPSSVTWPVSSAAADAQASALWLAAAPGLRFGVDASERGAGVLLAGGRPLGPLEVLASATAVYSQAVRRLGVRVAPASASAGLGVGWAGEAFGIYVQPQVRLTMLGFSGPSEIESGTRTLVAGGVGVGSRWSWVRTAYMDAGAALHLALWSQPRHFVLRGENVFSQPFFEVFAGPFLRIRASR